MTTQTPSEQNPGMLARLLTEGCERPASEIVAEVNKPNPSLRTRLQWDQLTAEQREVGVVLNVEANRGKPADKALREQREKSPVELSVEAVTPAKELANRFEKPYQSYKSAERELLSRGAETVTDRQAWEFLNEHGVDGYKPEPFDTWQRYVREARKFYDDRKNTPRGGRDGGSIVDADET
ncbi:MAG: hypothetical protein DWI21_08055 [Planctomycetota bacterium]|nr:MAG: hypothetical protein DWI21_08055 [Planctomycetota bacterium]